MVDTKLKRGDITLTACRPRDGQQRRVTRRCVTEPDGAQKVLLHRFGLGLPRRLRPLDKALPMP